jgi:hypothetical protein
LLNPKSFNGTDYFKNIGPNDFGLETDAYRNIKFLYRDKYNFPIATERFTTVAWSVAMADCNVGDCCCCNSYIDLEMYARKDSKVCHKITRSFTVVELDVSFL